MNNLEFSVPYNNEPETLDDIFGLKNWNGNAITEVYLSGPREYFGSGRIVPKMEATELVDTIDRIHGAGLRVNLVLNSTCEGVGWYSQKTVNLVMDFLKLAHEEHGVEAVTIANPIYISKVKDKFPSIEISASVLSNIDCVQRAVLFEKAGADIIAPDVNINRDLELLWEIKEATNAKLKVLVNEGCLYKCPFRQFHFNAESHASREISKEEFDLSFADFFGAGEKVISEDHSQLLKSCWIRPEDLRKYSKITNYFKIVGRAQLKSFVARAIQAYMEESWDGDLLDLVTGCSKRFSLKHGAYIDNKFLDKCGFFEMVTSCDNRCDKCDYCQDLADLLITLGVCTPGKADDTNPVLLAKRLEGF